MVARPILAVAALVLSQIALGCTLAASAQKADSVARVYHPSAPLPSFEVATIKLIGQNDAHSPNYIFGGSIRELIRTAYAPTPAMLTKSQVIGGPVWIDKDQYEIDGKAPPQLEADIQKMGTNERIAQQHIMEQSLLANRIYLKIHFESRNLTIYELVPAKDGLKIKEIAQSSSPDPRTPPPPMFAGQPIPAGTVMTSIGEEEIVTVQARRITMARLVQVLSSNVALTGDRPIIDRTGFTGYFDVDDMEWMPLDSTDSPNSSDAPSIQTALKESLGIKLVATKGPVEVVVIDSIEHSSEN
jgi:uncharacterized protein (TIGR03435 family)